MQLHIFPAVDIVIKTNRQRSEENIDQAKIAELAGSIAENGLIHPITLRQEDSEKVLVAGRRRLKALEHLWFLGSEVRCGGKAIPEGCVPCLFLGDINPIDAEEIELEENIRREDLNWKERADALARLADLRSRQAEVAGKPAPSITDIAREIKPEATKNLSDNELGAHRADVKADIMLGNALKDPAKAAAISPATSRKEAIKLLKRHEESQRNAALGQSIGAIFNSSMHSLRKGNCLDIMQQLPEASFDVILTDPPYGIGADDFSDSGGKTAGGHFYDDSYEYWRNLARAFSLHSFRLAKAAAHAYVFCDIDRFHEFKKFMEEASWKVFRTPFIWVNPTAMRAPWPEQGPQRKWQAVLYAVKGDRPCTRLYSDVLFYPSDPNLGHPAQKPVGLLTDLLRRTVRPGDSVLDPFSGSGSIFPAAHDLKVRATGIELDEAAFGIAAKRLGELK